MSENEPAMPAAWPPRWPDITDPGVLAALRAVERHRFVPRSQQGSAYEDIALPIGYEQTISQPYIVALMTQALHLSPSSRVLEVGTGTGYQAAILACIADHVWSIERIPALASDARERLLSMGFQVDVRQGDGYMGLQEFAPYDGIIVTAAAREVPPALVAQLADPGRLVIPLGADSWSQELWVFCREHGQFTADSMAEVRFVPLVKMRATEAGESHHHRQIREEIERLMAEARRL